MVADHGSVRGLVAGPVVAVPLYSLGEGKVNGPSTRFFYSALHFRPLLL